MTSSLPQELIRNKARNGQNCALLEQAYAVVSALPQRAENQLHVSLMENYPGTLEALVRHLLDARTSGADMTFTAAFLATHRAFTSTPALLGLMVDRSGY